MAPTSNRVKLENEFTMLLETNGPWQRTTHLSADSVPDADDDSMRLLERVKQCYSYIRDIHANYCIEQGLCSQSMHQTRGTNTFTELKSWILEHIEADNISVANKNCAISGPPT